MAKLRVLELFSGIGGMHSACQLVEAVLSQPLGILTDFPDIQPRYSPITRVQDQ
jgi:hypothetical protein